MSLLVEKKKVIEKEGQEKINQVQARIELGFTVWSGSVITTISQGL